MKSAGDHKALLAGLSASQRNELTHRSNRKALLPLFVHFGLIGVCFALVAAGVPAWQLCVLPMGILMVFLFTLLHETTHRTAFRTRGINIFVAGICGFVVLVPPVWFRYFHFQHHRYTHDPKLDPELEGTAPETLTQLIWHITGLPTWYSQLRTLMINAIGNCADHYVPATAASRVCIESRVILMLYVLLIALAVEFQRLDLVAVWVMALLAGQPFLRLYLMAEHGRCPFVENMFENTRTTFTNRVVRMLAWNMPFHAEHHAYPNVPFYNLPDLHRIVKAQLKVTSNGYLKFHRELVRSVKPR